MTPQEQDALFRENHRLKMIIVRTFRELDPCAHVDTRSDIDVLATLPDTIRNQLRLIGMELAR
ncbi:hypothetical protein GOZ97_07585 [Agrobacterium vitis]|uniref:hypothetical protein n=1 Tax=Agrobacterium vitis TaxID=373 RepID=UPI0008FAEB3A|nr:hypothetical protein [Agrobacterium vitis]MUZ53061.1 hypothetical protein [Agrobacterium vitis]MUZ91280.1 hypothetical protein [Agrobacterium vitis]MVA40276.1 hypothetical protein [Agrobacterium vitis]NSX96122.1 hypothetical protein [Agrobacterium vitis]NSZ27261.1 hypothetical protein [Agrobacterium vitis]